MSILQATMGLIARNHDTQSEFHYFMSVMDILE